MEKFDAFVSISSVSRIFKIFKAKHPEMLFAREIKKNRTRLCNFS